MVPLLHHNVGEVGLVHFVHALAKLLACLQDLRHLCALALSKLPLAHAIAVEDEACGLALVGRAVVLDQQLPELGFQVLPLPAARSAPAQALT